MNLEIPQIVGIMASSPQGTICYGESNEFTIGQAYPDCYQSLDRQVLRKTLELYKDDALFVIGEFTLDSMGKLLDGCEIMPSTPDLKEQELVSAAYAKALQKGKKHIVVLGGRAVYLAFTDKYDIFHHTAFLSNSPNICGNAKLVNYEKILGGGQGPMHNYFDITTQVDLKEISVKTYVRRKF